MKMMPEQKYKPITEIVFEPRARKQTKRFQFDAKSTRCLILCICDLQMPDRRHLALEEEEDEDAQMSESSSEAKPQGGGELAEYDKMSSSEDEPLLDDSKDELRVNRRTRWSPRTRSAFIRNLLLFGYGRWERIRREIGSSLTNAELARYARGYSSSLRSFFFDRSSHPPRSYSKMLCEWVNKSYDELLGELKEAATFQPERIKANEAKRLKRVEEEEKAAKKLERVKQEPIVDAMDIDEPIPSSTPAPTEGDATKKTEKDADDEDDEIELDPSWTDPDQVRKFKKTATNQYKRIRYPILRQLSPR